MLSIGNELFNTVDTCFNLSGMWETPINVVKPLMLEIYVIIVLIIIIAEENDLRARLGGDMKDMGLRPEMAMDREKWRCGIMGRTSDLHLSAQK